MKAVLLALVASLRAGFRSRAALQLEVLSSRPGALPPRAPLRIRTFRRLLGDYLEHYHQWRCHRSLGMDCPEPRPVQGPEHGDVVEVTEADGLYRHFERRAA
jgi:hypothetical protein